MARTAPGRGAVAVNLPSDCGDTPVIPAADHGHAVTVKAQLDGVRRLEQPQRPGPEPFAGAVFKNDPEVVRALLARGADPAAGIPSAVDTARICGQYGVAHTPATLGCLRRFRQACLSACLKTSTTSSASTSPGGAWCSSAGGPSPSADCPG
ncbi:hypothetical protein GCM10017786_12520 [Amycolatopsis deserti]|uniref:Ankyrin repeat domain-containing protein n=1 Tax=Amycolatopsis deserti TaxID=185696 RepID=A0ABQ3III1_9PSEU|nr:hypothetical protein GCM10017786_12520 [Amycolatopsis deserti]